MGKMDIFTPAPPAAVTRVLATFDREQLAGFITVAIDLLDFADGDPDLEPDDRGGETIPIIDDPEVPPEESDEDPDLEETDTEDSFALSQNAWADGTRGPGCEVADAGEFDGTEHDRAWAEWHTLSPWTQRDGEINERPISPNADLDEDAEEDDHSGDWATEDEPIGFSVTTHDGPGCIISDPDRGEYDETRAHRKRLQRDRCFPRYEQYRSTGHIVRNLRGYNLLEEPVVPSRRSLFRRKRGMPRRPRP